MNSHINTPEKDRPPASWRVCAGPAGTARTNIATGTYFVTVSGARPVGRTVEGKMVVRLPASPHGPRIVEARAAWGTGVSLGRWVTLAALVAALGALAWALLRRRPVQGCR